MSSDADRLTAEALALPPEERARIARALIASLDGDEADDADPREAESAVRRSEAARRAAHGTEPPRA